MKRIRNLMSKLQTPGATPFFVCLSISLFVFILNATYIMYPDEFVNLLGADAILSGKVPYRDFFDHHMPGAWYIGAPLLGLAGGSFTAFRIWWALFQFVALAGVGVWIYRTAREYIVPYGFFIIIYPLAGVYFWFHLFLADSLAALFACCIFWLLSVATFTNKPFPKLFTSIVTSLFVFSSATFVYVGGVFFIWQLMLLWQESKSKRLFWRELLQYVLISVLPWVVYVVYLFATGSLRDFWFSNIVYNTQYYIQISNYVRGGRFNPLRLLATLTYNFWYHFQAAIVNLKYFNFNFPVAESIVYGFMAFAFSLLRHKWYLLIGLFFLMSMIAPRSANFMILKESDYQSAVYIVLGLSAGVFGLFQLSKISLQHQNFFGLAVVLRGVLALYMCLVFMALTYNTYSVWFKRYSGTLTGIVTYTGQADALRPLIAEGEHIWVGPYNPTENFFLREFGDYKFPTLLPPFHQSEKLKSEFSSQFAKAPPEVLFINTGDWVLGSPYTGDFGDFFQAWVAEHYITLEQLGVPAIKHIPNGEITKHLFIRRDVQEVMLSRLKTHGYIAK